MGIGDLYWQIGAFLFWGSNPYRKSNRKSRLDGAIQIL